LGGDEDENDDEGKRMRKTVMEIGRYGVAK
jgi:hypothetical protein